MRRRQFSSSLMTIQKGKVNPMRKLCSIIVLSILISNVVGALGQSPAAPSLRSSAEVERRVESILSQMTLEEKIDLLGGVDGFFIRDVPRLNLPRLKMADGPIGVRNFGPATAMAGRHRADGYLESGAGRARGHRDWT